ncbi:unnamed protein product [Penicillium viridicatum]
MTSIPERSVVVVGAGIIGLASSLILAKAGYDVVIVARDLPGDLNTAWASPFAGANIIPPVEMGNKEMLRESIAHWQEISKAGPANGVKALQPVKATEHYTDRENNDFVWYRDLYPSFRDLEPSELAPGCKTGFTFQTWIINPDVLLPWLMDCLNGFGVQTIRAEVKSLDEAAWLAGGASVIVNASGLGAKSLANDPDVAAYRGQTMLIKSDYDEVKMIQGSEYTYVIPRPLSRGVIIGGVSEEGSENNAIDVELKQDILRRVNRLTNGAFSHVDVERDVMRDIVGFRPGRRTGIRVEKEGRVVHAYGFKGAGYVYSFGAANQIKRLVDSIVVHPRL